MQNIINHDLLYWHKEKGSQFVESFGLQLPAKIDSEAMSQSGNQIKTETDLSQNQSSQNEQTLESENRIDENSNNEICYSIKQSVADMAKSGRANAEPTMFDDLKAKDYQGFTKWLNKALGKLDEWVADGLRLINDWIDSLKEKGISTHEAERLKDEMYRAKGGRDALNSELEQAYLKPFTRKIAEITQAQKPDELSTKRLIGYWVSGRYAIEKNRALLNAEEKVTAHRYPIILT